MEPWVTWLAGLLLCAWLLKPYLAWLLSTGRPLEREVSRTSFRCEPGELVPPAWKEPAVTLSVVVPAYNEELRLPQMLDETLSYLRDRANASPAGFTFEVIVVDDGSRDNTYAAALAARRHDRPGALDELRVIRLDNNRGKGFALRVGMLAARGRLLLMADADGATGIRDLERLEQALSQQPSAQIAFGSRHHLQGAVKHGHFLMVVFHLLVWLLVGGSIQDTQCGFKLFHAVIGKRLFASLHLSRWAFDVEIIVIARALAATIVEVPVSFVDMPGSKLNGVTCGLAMLRDVIVLRILYAFGIWRPVTAA